MNRPLLSIIMPVYNGEKYLSNTLSCLLTQGYTEIEVICINDCSTDGSLGVLREFEKKDSRVKCISLDKNIGAGRARNIGIERSVGAYIAFLDADDEIMPDILSDAVSLIEETGAQQVVWGAVEEHYNAQNKHIRSVPIVPNFSVSEGERAVAHTALALEEQTLFGYLWNSLYNADIIRNNAIKMKDYIFYEDYFFNLDFIKKTDKIAVMNKVGYRYFKRVNSSITHSFSNDYYSLSYQRVKSFYEYCVSSEILDRKAVNILANKLLRYTLSALSRNNNPLAKLNGRQRKEWVKSTILTDGLYTALLSEDISTNPVFRLLKFAINKKLTSLCLFMGKAVYYLR